MSESGFSPGNPTVWIVAVAAALWVAATAGPVAAAEAVTLFVTSEKTDTVGVYRGTVPELVLVATIPVGREPHNMGISPDGRWVATSDRRSGEVSVIDTRSLAEAARIKLGRQTHDVAFSPDSRTLYVGHETETFISVVEVGTWRVRPPLRVGRAQHDLAVMDADADAEVGLVMQFKIGLHGLDLLQHLQAGVHRVQRRVGRVVQSEEGHDAVAHEVVNLPVVLVDHRRHAVEVAVEDVDHVVGQLRFGKGSEITDIREQDRQPTVLAHTARRAPHDLAIHQVNVLVVEDEAAQRHVAADGRLTGQPHVQAEVAAVGHLLFLLVARAAVLQSYQDQNPAGGALGVSAADVRVWDAVLQRRLQDGRGGVNFDGFFVGIGEARHRPSGHWRGIIRHSGAARIGSV